MVLPDVVVAAKPLACGLPLGALIANEKAAATIPAGMHGSTFGGGALACRVALEFFDILDGLLPSIKRVGDYFRARRFVVKAADDSKLPPSVKAAAEAARDLTRDKHNMLGGSA